VAREPHLGLGRHRWRFNRKEAGARYHIATKRVAATSMSQGKRRADRHLKCELSDQNSFIVARSLLSQNVPTQSDNDAFFYR
jgi:hypothetical protein